LNFSAWGDHVVSGEVTVVNDSWLKLKRKIWLKPKAIKDFELVPLHTIKRITVHTK